MAALSTVVAGPYTCTYSATSVGDVEDGFRLRHSVNKDLVRGDAYGDSAIDAVYRGGDVFLSYVCMEYSDAIAPHWPYGAQGIHGQVGRMDSGSSIVAATVLTAVAGTTAAAAPASLTASQSILDENHQTEILFASRARFVPISVRCYPYLDTAVKWYSVT